MGIATVIGPPYTQAWCHCAHRIAFGTTFLSIYQGRYNYVLVNHHSDRLGKWKQTVFCGRGKEYTRVTSAGS